MKIIIEAEPKEIADLVLEIQDRPGENVAISLDGRHLTGCLRSKLTAEHKRDHSCI